MTHDTNHTTTPDDLQRAFLTALQEYRADVQSCLLAMAYAGRPARGAPESEDDEHPMELAQALALPDPGGWPDALKLLMDGDSARRLRALGVDVAIICLAETRSMEAAEVGPEHGLLRRSQAHSPAWHALHDRLSAQSTMPLWQRADKERARHAGRLSASMQRALSELDEVLLAEAARQGVTLSRLAAAHAGTGGKYIMPHPAPVRDAPGWGIMVRLDQTVSNRWLVVAERVWLGAVPEPGDAPAVIVILRVTDPGDAREIRRCMPPGQRFVTWYESQPLGAAPLIMAEKEGDSSNHAQ